MQMESESDGTYNVMLTGDREITYSDGLLNLEGLDLLRQPCRLCNLDPGQDKRG